MSKREDDPQTDSEVGMTTAERRRRRRRGAGLRVPSDNVPRRTSPPVAPVPEDPSLAMSIAYSFSSDASQPVPQQPGDDGQSYADSAVPEPIGAVIDPPSEPVEQADFEMKTREMSAIDLEALGLTDLQARTLTDRDAVPRGSDGVPRSEPVMDDGRSRRMTRSEIRPALRDERVGAEEPTPAAAQPQPAPAPAPEPVYRRERERLRTVALTDEDLEEVREAVRAMEQTQAAAAAAAPAAPAAPAGQGSVVSPLPHMTSSPMAAALLGVTQGHIPMQTAAPAPAAAPQQAQATQSQSQSPAAPQATVPRSAATPPHGMQAVAARDTRSAADDMWGEDTPVPRPVPQEALRSEPVRAATIPPATATSTPAAAGPSVSGSRLNTIPPGGMMVTPAAVARSTTIPPGNVTATPAAVPRSNTIPPGSMTAPPAAVPRSNTIPPGSMTATPATPTPVVRSATIPPGSMVSGPAAPAAAGPAPAVVARSITLPPPSADQLHQISQSTRPQAQTPRDAEPPAGARSAEDSGGVPVIDLQSTPSGEFEVDVEPDDDAEDAAQAAAPAEAQRARTPSTPPPAGSTTGQLLAAAPAQPAAAVASGTPSGQHAVVSPAAGGSAPAAGKDPHHAHPPPPPPAALHHQAKPPAPPQPAKKESAAKPASSSSTPAASRTMTDRLRAKPWFVDVFDEDYLRTLPFLTPQATQAEAEFVANAMSLTPGQQVLDVGCGYGRHAMELAARGFHVVGLDLSAPLLLRGGEEAQRRGLQINFVRGDMRELEFESQFDGAYCLFSTFGYFDDETNKRTVANIARALKPGGRVLLEILNRDYVIADLPTRVWWEGDGCVVLEEVELNYFSSRIQVNRSVVFDDGRQVEQEISIRAYALHEVGKLMHAAGFRVLEVSGGYQTRGRFFGNQSRHIIVLAERKDPTAP